MLAAMCRIGDEALHLGVNNEIEKFQRHLSYEHRAIVADFDDIDEAIPVLDRQSRAP